MSPGLAAVARVSPVHGPAVSSSPSTSGVVAPGVAVPWERWERDHPGLSSPPQHRHCSGGRAAPTQHSREALGSAALHPPTHFWHCWRCETPPGSPRHPAAAPRPPLQPRSSPCGLPRARPLLPGSAGRLCAAASPPGPVLPRRPLRPCCLHRGRGRRRAAERAEEVTAAAGPAAGGAGSAVGTPQPAASAARRRLRTGGRTGVWGLHGPRQGMHHGKRHADPLAHPQPPQPAGLGGNGGGAPAPWGWLGRGRAGGGSSANVGCVGEQRALRHLPAPQGWGLTPHLVRGAPPFLGAGEGRAAQPGHRAHAKPGWQLGICFLAAWLLATKRCILGRVVRGAGGRTVPAASSPLRQTGPGARRPPRHRGDPELGAGSRAGKVWAHRPPPSTSWRPRSRTEGLCPGRAGPRAGPGASCSAPGLQQNRRGPGPPAELALR